VLREGGHLVVRRGALGDAYLRNTLQGCRLIRHYLGCGQQFAQAAGSEHLSGGIQAARQAVLEEQAPQPPFVPADSLALGHRRPGTPTKNGKAIFRDPKVLEGGGQIAPEGDYPKRN